MMQTAKSPSAPSKSLQYCLDVAEKLYNSYGHSTFSAVEIASTVGQSSTSGPFKVFLSALKQYGLLEKDSRSSFRIAQVVKDYAAIPPAEEAVRDAIRYKLISQSSFFSTLLEKLNGRLPEPPNLANILMSQFGFNKAKAHDTAKAFCDSLEWAHALDHKRNILPPREDSFPHANLSESDLVSDDDEGRNEMANNLPREKDMLTFQIPLTVGRIAELHYPYDMTPEEATKICNVLTALSGAPMRE